MDVGSSAQMRVHVRNPYRDVRLQVRIDQGSLAEITNQRFSLKYQTFRQLAAATDEGSSKLPKRLVFQRKSLVGDFRKRTLSDATQPDKLLQ